MAPERPGPWPAHGGVPEPSSQDGASPSDELDIAGDRLSREETLTAGQQISVALPAGTVRLRLEYGATGTFRLEPAAFPQTLTGTVIMVGSSWWTSVRRSGDVVAPSVSAISAC